MSIKSRFQVRQKIKAKRRKLRGKLKERGLKPDDYLYGACCLQYGKKES